MLYLKSTKNGVIPNLLLSTGEVMTDKTLQDAIQAPVSSRPLPIPCFDGIVEPVASRTATFKDLKQGMAQDGGGGSGFSSLVQLHLSESHQHTPMFLLAYS